MSLADTLRANRATVVAGFVVALVVLAGFSARLLLAGEGQGNLVALVHDADGQVHELPLSQDAQLVVVTSLGSNTITVEDGAVRMLDADCPNRTCLQVAPLTEPGPQIICLPHKLWIEVVPAGEQGGALDVNRAEQLDDGIDLQAR